MATTTMKILATTRGTCRASHFPHTFQLPKPTLNPYSSRCRKPHYISPQHPSTQFLFFHSNSNSNFNSNSKPNEQEESEAESEERSEKIPASPPPTVSISTPGWPDKIAAILPGVAASAVVMQGGFMGAEFLGKGLLYMQGIDTTAVASPISGIPVSILLGLAIGNSVKLPDRLSPGIKFAQKTVLQAGVVCVGAKLSALDLVTTGAIGLPAVCLSIAAGMTFVPWFGDKMGLPHKMSSLIAAGTSICGVTAITALAPAIKANQQETSFAVANVVAFGTLGMLVYPYMAHAIFSSSHQIGMFLGLSIHDTSQVIGSALTYSTVYGDEEVLKVAAITKLSRNLFLAGVIPGLTYMTARREGLIASDNDQTKGSLLPTFSEFKKYVPGFVVGFVGMSVLRTTGDAMLHNFDLAYGVLDAQQWKNLTSTLGTTVGSRYLLGTAMAAVGLGTSASALKGVGYKPFVVGMGGAAVVGSVGFTSTCVLGYLFL